MILTYQTLFITALIIFAGVVGYYIKDYTRNFRTCSKCNGNGYIKVRQGEEKFKVTK